jgi:SPASM domain peptide maturase of grasp-with-spasm system
MENYLYNGCLNKKISIDENGEIKNCPSMKKSFGNILKTSIVEVAKKDKFRELWKINKRQIKVCMNCEYRCICTDCRAFLSNPNDLFSKPAKYYYDPYTLKWK